MEIRSGGACTLTAAAALLLVPAILHAAELKRTGGPYVPTPQVVVDRMLQMAAVGADDFVIDLGSGDGIIVLTAVQQMQARGLGVDIDPELVALSNELALRRGIADRAQFEVRDVFNTDLGRASVLTLYLLPGMMARLEGKVFRELKPGARVVSHDYRFPDWKHDDVASFEVPEKVKVNGVPRATIFLWTVPAKISGRWTLSIAGAGGGRYELDLWQRFQTFGGSARAGGQNLPLEMPRLRGATVEFALATGGGKPVFRGRVAGDGETMHGTVEFGAGRQAAWTAARVLPQAVPHR